MAKHIVKCKYCGLSFDANVIEYVQPSARRYAHKDCHLKYLANQTQEERDEEEFYAYVKQLFKEDFNYITTKKMAAQYIKENGYTYSGMLKSLKWFYELQHHSTDKANGAIGIIPYIYNQARDYYYSLFLAQEANKEKDIKNFVKKTRVIEIESPEAYLKKPRLFNMEDDD